MIGLDAQELLLALNRHLELTFLVGDHAQNVQGIGVLSFLQYALTNFLGLLQAAFLIMV